MKNIQPVALNQLLQTTPIKVIDVRSAGEFRRGHVPGAVNVPLGSLDQLSTVAEPTEQIAVICLHGSRSEMACKQIQSHFPNMLNVVGGTAAWRAAGLPIQGDSVKSMTLVRQTHLLAGSLLTTAFFLSMTVNRDWVYLGLIPTLGLILDALTGFCLAGYILGRMPWNRSVA